MKKVFLLGIVFILFSSISYSEILSKVHYETDELEGGRWKYTYKVENVGLAEGIKELTIWFDEGLCSDLTLESPTQISSEWDEITVQPEPVINANGYYDALYLTSPIGLSESVAGFSVSFNWLGNQVDPAAQFYEIIDPVTFETIDEGFTVPEPATMVLLCISVGALRIKRNII